LLLACASHGPDAAWRSLDARSKADLRAEPNRPDAATEVPIVPTTGPLTLTQVTAAVVHNNRRLEAMRHSLRAMVHMRPQQMAMPDPTLEVGIAPLVVHTGRGQRISFRQPLPWPGTLGARGRVVLEDALAMEHDLDAMRQMVVAMAHMSWWELGATARLRQHWHDHHLLIETLRQSIIGRVSANRARPVDVMTAESELILADQKLLLVDRMERQASAKLNVLMHRSPDAPFGAVAWPNSLPPDPPPLADLLQRATTFRPEFAAAEARVRSREAAIEAAEKMNRPMLGFGVEVSTMVDDWMMWPMLMLMVELPLATARRDAMVDEARARHTAERYSREALAVELAGEVALRHAELVEALASHATLASRLLPALEQRLAFSLAAYGSGQEAFDGVLMAATAITEVRLELVETRLRAFVAATWLDLAIGRLSQQEPTP